MGDEADRLIEQELDYLAYENPVVQSTDIRKPRRMTNDDIQKLKDLLNDEYNKWSLDVGDWIAYVEELIDEVERLRKLVNLARDNYIAENDDGETDCVTPYDIYT